MEALSISLTARGESPSLSDVHLLDFGLVDYRAAHQKQLELHSSVTLGNSNEAIIITEHFPVYTCGRRTSASDQPQNTPIPIIDVERGGELTYHGPGQIVGYPILNLAKRRLSVPQYLRKLEGALSQALQEVGVEAKYRPDHLAGLWVTPPPVLSPKAIGPSGQGTGGGVDNKKLVSIGIAVRHWVTFHGFALNVDCDLSPFRAIRPCGLSGTEITSLKELGCLAVKEKVKRCVVRNLIQTFC